MNFQHVTAFCTIVSEGSFSRAAERLHLTQPTISAQIQSLERTLGTRLFERSAQGISLTQAGRVFHPYALQLLEMSHRAEQAMDELQALQRGRLDVGASSVPGQYLLPGALALFKSRQPGIEIRLAVSNTQDVRNGVREGAYELGVVGDRVRDERLTYEPVGRDRLVVVMRPEHPLADRPSLTTRDLAGQPIIMREYGSGTRATLEHAFESAGLSVDDLHLFLELGSTESVKTAIRAVDALAIMSEWAVRDEARTGLLRVASLSGIDPTRDLFVIWRSHGVLSVVGEAFLRFLREEYLRPEARS